MWVLGSNRLLSEVCKRLCVMVLETRRRGPCCHASKTLYLIKKGGESLKTFAIHRKNVDMTKGSTERRGSDATAHWWTLRTRYDPDPVSDNQRGPAAKEP